MMLKNILNLEGAQELSKIQQKSTIGGANGNCVEDDNGVCATCTGNEQCVEIREGGLRDWCVVGYACVPLIGNQ